MQFHNFLLKFPGKHMYRGHKKISRSTFCEVILKSLQCKRFPVNFAKYFTIFFLESTYKQLLLLNILLFSESTTENLTFGLSLDSHRQPEESYKIVSVCLIIPHPSIHLFGRFLGIISLVFSKVWHDARSPYEVVYDRAEDFRKKFLSQN